MPNRRAKLLWDAVNAGEAIEDFIGPRSRSDYANDRLLRSAVERQCEIIGEALRRIALIDTALADRISERQRIVDFRNAIAHGYDSIDDDIVWQAAKEKLPTLLREARLLLAEATDAGSA